MKHKLTAILSADVKGYSQLMGQDEISTVATLNAYKETMASLIKKHRGRVVDSPGDNLLAEFASVFEAVKCAAAIQKKLKDENDAVSDDRKMQFRIGIHSGDVIQEEDRIYGDSLNIAVRLEGLAEAGGICISSSVYDQVCRKLDFDYEDLGEQRLKNIAQATHVYRIKLKSEQLTEDYPRLNLSFEAALTRPAVAVLPFLNMSGSPEQEYFSDGITEDITTALSYCRVFPVIARNSTFVYKGQAIDVKKVAKELGARYVLEGSIRKAGNRVRVTAKLVDGTSGHQIWAERYDRDLGNVFDLQDDLTERIVTSIEPQLNWAEQERAIRIMPDNLDAWDCCLRALWHIYRSTREDYIEAHRLLLKAIEMDPKSSYPQSVLALCCFNEALLGWSRDPPSAFIETLEAAKKAVALDERDWLAHALFGIACLWTHRQYDRGIEELERAISLNPSAAASYQFLGCVLAFAGRPAEAIPKLNATIRLNPHHQSMSIILADLALCHLLLQDFEKAVGFAKRAVREQPENVRSHQRLASCLGHAGRKEEARIALDELIRLQPDFSLGYIDATYPFRNSVDRALFIEGLIKAGMNF